jgi:hypothetical protein
MTCFTSHLAALDLPELLVAQDDLFSRELGVGAAQQVAVVEVLLGKDGGLVDTQQAAGGAAQEARQAGPGGDRPRSS